MVLAVPAHHLLQIIFMTSAWVFICIASIFQINTAFAPGKNWNIRFVGACVFDPKSPSKKGRSKLKSLNSDTLVLLFFPSSFLLVSSCSFRC